MQENQHHTELKKEAGTFLGLVFLMAVAVGYKTITDNRVLNKQTICQQPGENLSQKDFDEMQNIMLDFVSREDYESAAKVRNVIRKKYGYS